MDDIIMEHLQDRGVGRLLCHDLGIDMDEYEIDMTSCLWGVRINMRQGNRHEELSIFNRTGDGSMFDGKILVSRVDAAGNLGNMVTYDGIKAYRTRKR